MGGGKEGGSGGYWCYCKDWATNKCKKMVVITVIIH